MEVPLQTPPVAEPAALPACPLVAARAGLPDPPVPVTQPTHLSSTQVQQPGPNAPSSPLSPQGHSNSQQPASSLQGGQQRCEGEAQPSPGSLPAREPPRRPPVQQQQQLPLPPPPPALPPDVISQPPVLQPPAPVHASLRLQKGVEKHCRKQAHPLQWQPREPQPGPAAHRQVPTSAAGSDSAGQSSGAELAGPAPTHHQRQQQQHEQQQEVPSPTPCHGQPLTTAAAPASCGTGSGHSGTCEQAHAPQDGTQLRGLAPVEEGPGQTQEQPDGRKMGARMCSNCGTDSTGRWRRHPTTPEWLCGTCHQYLDRHGEERPVGMRCLQCSRDSPGATRGPYAAWRPHPTTGDCWLCGRCFSEALEQAKQGRQDKGRMGQQKQKQKQKQKQQKERARQRGRQERPAEQAGCSHCGTGSACRWARHPTTDQRLCASCRDYMRNHNGEEKPLGVCCLQCSRSSPGATMGPYAGWRQHPTTGKRWLCSNCYKLALKQTSSKSVQDPAKRQRCLADGSQGVGAEPAAKRLRCSRPHSQPNQPATTTTEAAAAAAVGTTDATLRGSRQQAQQQVAQQAQQQAQQQAAQQAQQQQAQQAVQQAAQQEQQQAQQPTHQQDIFEALVAAASAPAAAGAGLTADLAAAFSSLMDTLPAHQQAAKEARLRALLAGGLHSAAAKLMETALRLALPPAV